MIHSGFDLTVPVRVKEASVTSRSFSKGLASHLMMLSFTKLASSLLSVHKISGMIALDPIIATVPSPTGLYVVLYKLNEPLFLTSVSFLKYRIQCSPDHNKSGLLPLGMTPILSLEYSNLEKIHGFH